MFTAAYKAVGSAPGGEQNATDEFKLVDQEYLPQNFTLAQLDHDLSRAGKEHILERILLLQSCLKSTTRLSRQADDEDALNNLSIWVSRSILPDASLVPQDDHPTDEEVAAIATTNKRFNRLATHALQSLTLLQSLRSPTSSTIPTEVLLTSITYTSHDAWTTPSTQALASSILATASSRTATSDFLVDYLLQSTIRPLFSKSRPSTVTTEGRRAMESSAPTRRPMLDAEKERQKQPWKWKDVWAVGVLEWIVENISEDLLRANWNLFIPPILTLIDDPSTSVRFRGLQIVQSFLPKYGTSLLSRTGLSSVFEDTLLPTLLYLPSLTPLDESVQLLPLAYRALESLWNVQFNGAENSKAAMAFLDRVMRAGILRGYSYCPEHPEIVNILLGEMAIWVRLMGVHSVKYLKDMIPIVATPLNDPFATSHLSLLLNSLTTLQVILKDCRPRIDQPYHRRPILQALATCWLTLTAEIEIPGRGKDEKKLEVTKAQLVIVGRELGAILKEGEGQSDLQAFIAADKDLRKVFGV